MIYYPKKIYDCDGLSLKERIDVCRDEVIHLYDTLNDRAPENINKLTGLGFRFVTNTIEKYTSVSDAYT